MQKLFTYLFILINLVVFGQKNSLVLEVTPTNATVGEPLNITIKSTVQGNVEIDFPKNFTQGYNVMSGSNVEVDYSTGRSVAFYYLSQSGTISKAGTYKFGPAYIKKGNKVFRSNTVSVTIQKEQVATPAPLSQNFSKQQLRQIAFGVIEKSKASVYEGEAVTINARVYAQFNASHIENYQTYGLSNVNDKHQLDDLSSIKIEPTRIKNRAYFTFNCDKKVVFFSGSGTKTIEPFTLSLYKDFDGLDLASYPTTIEIKPLPKNKPANFNGGVGSFSLSEEISAKSLKKGDVFTLKLTLKGTGNLQNIQAPDLNLPSEFKVYGDPVIKENYRYTENGVEGKITYVYSIQANFSGEKQVPALKIAFFNPQKEKFEEIQTKEATITTNEAVISARSSGQSIELVRPTTQRTKSESATTNILQKPLFWSLSIPLLFAFFLGFIQFRKKKETPTAIVVENKPELIAVEEPEIDFFNDAAKAFEAQQENTYYTNIENGMIAALAKMLSLKNDTQTSKELVIQTMQNQAISDELQAKIKSIFEACTAAKYGFEKKELENTLLLEEAKEVIGQLKTK
jgi:hypothetical protein